MAVERILFLPHAIRQMSRPDRMISPAEAEAVVIAGELVESYLDDARGPSALLLGAGVAGRAIHVVVAPKDEYLAIITAYLPDPAAWDNEFKTRRQS